jgi:hypothetical protein
MPMEYDRYPKDWRAIAVQIKKDAGWICQHCGKPCRKVGEAFEAFEKRLAPVWRPLLSEKLADYKKTEVSKQNAEYQAHQR